MKVKIKRIDKELPLPLYQTFGAIGFDLITRETTVIEPHSIGRIPSNVIVEVPEGYMLYLKDRSSTAKKKGLLSTAGIIDQDFCGEGDELLFQVYNFQDTPVTIERGERVGQGIFLQVGVAQWEEVESMGHNKTRGSFGTTGGHK